MWEAPGASAGAAGFERRAADALAAWRAKRFELPDSYLGVAPAQPEAAGPDLYLGPLRAVRPPRAAVAGIAASPGQAARPPDTLRSLGPGPWVTPLHERT